jgi:hypothetical protein
MRSGADLLRWILLIALVATVPVGAAQGAEEEGAGAAEERRPRPSIFRRPGASPAPEQAEQPARPSTRRPGQAEAPAEPLPPPLPVPEYEFVGVPDRWRIVESLGVNEKVWDPYNQNTLKADRPIFGTQDWFFNLNIISDTTFEPRRIPTPVGGGVTEGRGSLDIFGREEQLSVVENLILSTSIIQGDTVFRPPDYEFRFTGVGNYNYTEAQVNGLLRADPSRGDERTDWHFGVQELFLDKHLWNKSDRYDFDSLRVGIQPFISDFRGFLFQDNQLGARLFGTFRNNRLQYNLAYFRRLEKETNSGLNKWADVRDDDIVFANLYYQDFPVLGFTQQATVVWNHNTEGDDGVHYNKNGFLERPAPIGDARGHEYDVVYLGLNGDGHFDRLNLTYAVYYALGRDNHQPIASRATDIDAWFAAAEASIDYDWWRFKLFGLFSSGDDDPFDDEARGFDAIFENPQFAGADTSFWQRQAIPFIFGGGVVLSSRNALIPSLRTSKEEGQSNFVNPGLIMAGVGADFDILPELRLVANASWLSFHDTSSLRVLRVQEEIGKEIGWDLSAAIIYRPLFTENIVLRVAGAFLLPGEGMKDIYDARNRFPFYSVLANVILTY